MARRRRGGAGLDAVGEAMDQPLLAATPLPVAARARIDVRAEAIMDRSWGLGGRRNWRGTFLCRRSQPKEDVAVGGAEGWVVVGIRVLKCGGVVAPAEQLPSPAGGAAGEEGRGVGGERGGGADEGCGRRGGVVVAGAGVERGEGRSWGPRERVREGAILPAKPKVICIITLPQLLHHGVCCASIRRQVFQVRHQVSK
jgi:hypothetical protein